MTAKVARKCACTGYLEADPTNADSVETEVRAHRQDIRHRAWAAGAQLRGELVAPHAVALVPTLAILRRLR